MSEYGWVSLLDTAQHNLWRGSTLVAWVYSYSPGVWTARSADGTAKAEFATPEEAIAFLNVVYGVTT
jgi:hypothetical protein